MDFLKKVAMLVVLLSVSGLIAGCGGEDVVDQEAGSEPSGAAEGAAGTPEQASPPPRSPGNPATPEEDRQSIQRAIERSKNAN